MSLFLWQYMSGFGNEFSSEDPRCPGSLPEGQVTQETTQKQTDHVGFHSSNNLFTNFAVIN